MLPLLDSYLFPKFYFTHGFESFIHQLLFIIDLRFSKWGRKIVHSHHSQQQSNCCTNERGWMGKKSRETKSFSVFCKTGSTIPVFDFTVEPADLTIYRFLDYFRFSSIIGPDWKPVPGWTGKTVRSGPVFKTMAIWSWTLFFISPNLASLGVAHEMNFFFWEEQEHGMNLISNM